MRRRGPVDFLRNIIRDGKGAKDRIAMLPETLDRDLAENWGRDQMPDALDRKYPNTETDSLYFKNYTDCIIIASRTERWRMKLTKGDVAGSDLVAGLAKIIRSWEPGDLANEQKYRNSLFAYLREAIPSDCSVEKEYRHAGTTTDLFVRWSGLLFKSEAFIEVKRNLDKKATLDRLVGQIEALQPGKRRILVVLVGKTDDALLGRFKEKYKYYFDAQFEQHLAIIVKPTPVPNVG